MAISFMHCKNVSLEAIVPPEKLSRRHVKRHGRPLVSYSELTIGGNWQGRGPGAGDWQEGRSDHNHGDWHGGRGNHNWQEGRGEGDWEGGHNHYGHRGYYGWYRSPYGYYPRPYAYRYSYGGYGGCGWLYANAIASGDPYLWEQYYACVGY
jgi:hypothetical protein